MRSDRRVHEPYVFAAILFALTAGFGYAALLVAALAFGLPIGLWWIAMAQAHGHAQLFGWTGLFVLGVGLFFLPRLRGTVLARPNLARYALAAWVVGIALRALVQPLGASGGDTFVPRDLLFAALAGSGIIALVGAFLIYVMAAATVRNARPLGPDAPIRPVLPFLVIAGASFALASILNAALSINSALTNNFLFPSSWSNVQASLLIYGFTIPLAFAMSVRSLPLFMRLAAPPKRELLPLGLIYALGLILHLTSELVYTKFAAGLGALCMSGAILAFVWMLDVIMRRKPAWTLDRVSPPSDYVEMREPTRQNYPDYGEFGRFELLVISAFVWLGLAAAIAIFNGFNLLFDVLVPFNRDIERHALTVGFVTLLIFGMAVRMLPGFSGKSRIASPRLVLATFWLGNLAAIFRVMPLFVPGLTGANIALGASGAIGWIAVLCLGVNLWRTFRE